MITLNQLTNDQVTALHGRLVAKYNQRYLSDRLISRYAVLSFRAFQKCKPPIEVGKLYDVPSGMGGTFTVQALRLMHNGGVDCRIYMPLNPDWHGWTVQAKAIEMKALDLPRPPANWVDKLRKDRRENRA
jgi:hypothetical protein